MKRYLKAIAVLLCLNLCVGAASLSLDIFDESASFHNLQIDIQDTESDIEFKNEMIRFTKESQMRDSVLLKLGITILNESKKPDQNFATNLLVNEE